jgi:hypothetical protein
MPCWLCILRVVGSPFVENGSRSYMASFSAAFSLDCTLTVPPIQTVGCSRHRTAGHCPDDHRCCCCRCELGAQTLASIKSDCWFNQSSLHGSLAIHFLRSYKHCAASKEILPVVEALEAWHICAKQNKAWHLHWTLFCQVASNKLGWCFSQSTLHGSLSIRFLGSCQPWFVLPARTSCLW